MIVDNYDYGLNVIAEDAARKGVPIVLCTVPVNSRDWMPYVSVFQGQVSEAQRQAWLLNVQRAARLLERGRAADGLEVCRLLLAEDRDPAVSYYLAAKAYEQLGDLDQAKVSVHVNDLCIVSQGRQHPEYREADGARVMANDELTIRIDLGRDSASEQVWTSDLSYEYVKINAEYRT